jgi:hypothetical protein
VILKASSLFDEHLIDIYITCIITRVNGSFEFTIFLYCIILFFNIFKIVNTEEICFLNYVWIV